MTNYATLVDECFAKKTSTLIYNSSREHAKLLVKKLIESADKEILLYTGGADFEFYNDPEMVSILAGKAGVKIRILSDDLRGKTDFSGVFPNAKISVLNSSKDLGVLLSAEIDDMDYRYVKHFMVVDGKAFRVELPHGEDTKDVSAVACANNRKIGKELRTVFEKIQKKYAA